MGYLQVAAAALLWGCWSLFLRPAGLSGVSASALLFLVMALPALVATRRPLVRDRRSTGALLILGLSDATNAVLYFEALRRGPIAVAVLTHYLTPLLVALAAPWVLKEPVSRRALLAAPLSLGGLALVLYQPASGFPLETALLGAGSALFYATNVVTSKAAARAYSAIEITSLHAIVSVLALAVAFPGQLPWAASGGSLLWGIAGALLCGLVATFLFNSGLRQVPSAVASALTYLEPLTAALVGLWVFQEPLGPWGAFGTLLVLALGVWVALEPPRELARVEGRLG